MVRDRNRSLRPSGVLSRDLILTTAFRLASTEKGRSLTMTRLGQELKADPTAVYRHFRNRDELIFMLGDQMYGEALAALGPMDDWTKAMRDMAWALRRSYLERPALAVEAAPRFTSGPNEQRGVNLILDVLRGAGLEHLDAVRYARSFFELTLGHIVITASMLSLPVPLQAVDVSQIQLVYSLPADRMAPADGDSPSAKDQDQVFDTMLEVFLAGLAAAVEGQASPIDARIAT